VQVAIVTGAAGGIGLAMSKKLAEMGMMIIGTGRDAKKLAELEAEIGNPAQVATIAMDVKDDDAPKRIVDFALERGKRIDFLINNAGEGRPKAVHLCDDEMLDHFLNLMLRAPFRLCREAIPHMKPGSAIINVTSTFAEIGGRNGGAYSAAKGGLSSLTEHIACEYGALGIRANNVAPGVVPTAMTIDRLKDEAFRRMNVEMTPHTRLGNVNDIASTIAFLCSPGGEFLNGQTLVVDGGWTKTKYLSPYALTSTWTAPEAKAG
jgi:NAD(P)-dependent dehydrogenase (short-subunit alcohol dehydrogenase family)